MENDKKSILRKSLQFLKESYPSILRSILIVGTGVVLVWGCVVGYVVVYEQKTTVNEKITETQNQIDKKYNDELQKYNEMANSPECQAIIKKYKETQGIKRFELLEDYSRCTTYPSDFTRNSLVRNSEIGELNNIKESSSFALFFHLFFQKILPFLFFIACIIVGIPIVRILWLLVKKVHGGGSRAKKELAKMTIYQRYTVILLIAILMALVLIAIF